MRSYRASTSACNFLALLNERHQAEALWISRVCLPQAPGWLSGLHDRDAYARAKPGLLEREHVRTPRRFPPMDVVLSHPNRALKNIRKPRYTPTPREAPMQTTPLRLVHALFPRIQEGKKVRWLKSASKFSRLPSPVRTPSLPTQG